MVSESFWFSFTTSYSRGHVVEVFACGLDMQVCDVLQLKPNKSVGIVRGFGDEILHELL